MAYENTNHYKRTDIEDYFSKLNDNFYKEIDLDDFEWSKSWEAFTYPCPCGDVFTISKEDLLEGEIIARCMSCTLKVKVIYDEEQLENL